MKLTQWHLTKHPEKLDRFDKVRIWSEEWGMWWRANGSGYTDRIEEAGIYDAKDAWERTRHCGPEKKIVIASLDWQP